jgi:methylated-DNA-[protein]-cysteine S-methyltransferase
MDFAVFPTEFGWMAIAGAGDGITGVALPACDLNAALDRLCAKLRLPPADMREVESAVFGTLTDRLTAYMRGEAVEFQDPLDTSGWTDFRFRIWSATRLIPYGQTRSYSWVAAAAGQPTASRAAGQALHVNPVPILVPCHRVIGADRTLTGFGGGLALKERLIALESQHSED